jgi:dolichol kinase
VRAQKKAVLKQRRSLPHSVRRAYHLGMGVLCFLLYAFWLDQASATFLIAALGGPLILFDILRLNSSSVRNLVLRYFGPLMRRNEMLRVTGNSFFILGIFCAVAFFSKPVALLSILYLAVGDPIAAFVGTRFGRTKLWSGKSLEGALANAAASFLVTWIFFLLYLGKPGFAGVFGGLIGAFVSTSSELVPLEIDDNFSVPLLAAIQLTLIDRFVGLF